MLFLFTITSKKKTIKSIIQIQKSRPFEYANGLDDFVIEKITNKNAPYVIDIE